MADLSALQERLSLEAAKTHLPMWTDWGVRDSGHLIHSLGCTFLTAVGRDLGFAAVTEVPAPRDGILSAIDDDVRSDSVWFDRTSRRVALIAEFERYSGKQKDLRPKAETLLLAHHRWRCDDAVLFLAYWTIGLVSPPDHELLKGLVREGFDSATGIRVTGRVTAKVLLYQFVVQEGQDELLRLSSVIPRGEK